MIIQQERKKKTERAIYLGAAILALASFIQIMSFDTALANRIAAAVIFLLGIAGVLLYFLVQEWEGVVVGLSAKRVDRKDEDGFSESTKVHYAEVRTKSELLIKVRLGSDEETVKNFDIGLGDRIIKKRWDLFCMAEKWSPRKDENGPQSRRRRSETATGSERGSTLEQGRSK